MWKFRAPCGTYQGTYFWCFSKIRQNTRWSPNGPQSSTRWQAFLTFSLLERPDTPLTTSGIVLFFSASIVTSIVPGEEETRAQRCWLLCSESLPQEPGPQRQDSKSHSFSNASWCPLKTAFIFLCSGKWFYFILFVILYLSCYVGLTWFLIFQEACL